MNTKKLKELRNALSCWQDDYDCDDDKEQYDMFGAAIDAVSRLEAAESERDELRLEIARIGGAKAIDVLRRDAAAREPVAWQYRYNDGKVGDWKTVDSESECNHSPCYERRSIYTAAPPAAPPAVLPDIDRYTHGLFPHAVEQLTRFRDDALALGAQQQKVVELPEPVKWPEIPFKYFSEEQVFSMLDAAGVKWEVKK